MSNEFYFVMIIIGMLIMVILAFFFGKSLGKRIMYDLMQDVIQNERKDAIKKSRGVLTGQFSEQISAYLPEFPCDPSEVRFIGKPIDFIAFSGLNEQEIDEVVFIEVKTGQSKLNKTERSLKRAIKNKRVRFEEYRVRN